MSKTKVGLERSTTQYIVIRLQSFLSPCTRVSNSYCMKAVYISLIQGNTEL